MKRTLKIIIAASATVLLILIFYFFFPHVWGEAVYPLEYKDSIVKYAKQQDLDPNLVCALIYTESRFNNTSTSGAGARGLMQIMPGTGASIASDMGDSNYSPDNLYDPDTNIRYGTYYIKGLIDKYGGNLDLALAAYNAGVARADAWKDGRESLPFETVFYIQHVKDVQDMYNKVYGPWTFSSAVRKPNPFYQGITNFSNFVHSLILGR
jgi:soluble lytic murein transglycosylase